MTGAPVSWGLLRAVVDAELRQHLRDPLTLVLMVAVPLVLYPALGAGGHALAKAQADRAEGRALTIATEPAFDLPEGLDRVEVVELRAAVESGQVAAAVRLGADGAELYFDSRQPDSLDARGRLRDAVRAHRRATAAREVREEDLTAPEVALRRKVGALAPLLLLFTLLTGGLYTALDVVTGEKERGTLETLLTTAVDRRVIVLGKALVVFVFTAASALMAALSGTLSARWLAGVELSAATVAAVLVLFLPVCALATAILMAAAAWSRDFKSGQILSTPVLLVPVALAGAALVPGLDLNVATAVLPLTGMALATRDVLAGAASLPLVGLAFVGTLAWAGAALAFAARLLGREDVLLGASGGSQRRLRGDHRADAGALFGLGLLALWFLGQTAQAVDLVPGMVLTQVGLFVPLAVAAPWWLGLPVRETLRLRGAPAVEWLRAGVAGLALPGLAVCVHEAQNLVFRAPTGMFEDVFPVERPLWQLVLVFAVLPGVCEELLFRGAFYGLWQTRGSRGAAVVVTALAFGAFHLSVFRFLPTAVLGVALGVLSVRARSVLPGMLAHTLNNAFAMVVLSYGLPLEFGPPLVVAAAAAVVVLLVRPAALSGSATGRSAAGQL